MDFAATGIFFGFCMMAFLVLVGDRWFASKTWRGSLVAYRLRFPSDLSAEVVAGLFSVVSGVTRRSPIVFEVMGTSRGITHHVLFPRQLTASVISRLSAAMPGIRIDDAPEYLRESAHVGAACELRSSHPWKPLAADRSEPTVTGLLSSLYPLGRGEAVRIQWIVSGTHHERIPPEEPSEIVRALRDKQRAAMLEATGRIAVTAARSARSRMLMAGVLNGLHAVNAPGSSLKVRTLPSAVVARRIAPRSLPLTRWPALFNAVELAAVAGIPLGGVVVPGLATGTARKLPPRPELPRRPMVVAYSNYPGMVNRPLALRTGDRLQHVVIHGPTGAGKSTVIANMALQDIDAGSGVVVIDPKHDLVDDILARIPSSRTDDVILLDPSNMDRPIGYNILACGRDIHSRELIVDQVTHLLSQIWKRSWGPRTSDVIRSGLLTLTHTQAADGSAFTIAELPELLINPAFRRYVTGQPGVPATVRGFWTTYEQMSDAERVQVIGPTMNKLRTILTRSSLRLMLSQSTGIDLGRALFAERKIILAPLSGGIIGTDAAQLLGSLLVEVLWQATLQRVRIRPEKRRAAWAYLDEFQEFVHFSGDEDLAVMLAQARSFGLGLTMAHQYLDQLPAYVLAGVLGTVRSQMVFQLGYTDANRLAKHGFAPLGVEDLSNLDTYEVAVRPCVNSRTLPPVTGSTRPLGTRLHDPAVLAAASALRHGQPRELVEQARAARVRVEGDRPVPLGRKERR